MNPHIVQTRIPSFLWDALQDVFYDHDAAFLRAIAPYIPNVKPADIKRTLLGARGQSTKILVGDTCAWWETELCPLMERDGRGVWRQCGQYREGTGFCRKHRDFWESTPILKRKEDPWFKAVEHRTPWRFEGEILWVSTNGDAIREDGSPIPGIRVISGVLTQIEEHT